MGEVLTALAILGGLGLLFGALLGIASIVFRVKTDERVEKIIACLPGANCGGCGYAGCANFAQAVVDGAAAVNGCPVSNAAQKAQIAEVMGQSAQESEKLCATVLCSGAYGVAEKKYQYYGIDDCNAAMRLGGGQKQCAYACLGLGTCVKACKFDAIHVKDGVATVDREKCTACGMCVKACPKHVIELIPASAQRIVLCKSQEKGPVVTKACRVGCIGCRLCVKTCPVEAITVENNLAKINYEKCINCGMCKEKCPRGIIA